MSKGKMLLTAAMLAGTSLAGSANAAPWDHRIDHRPLARAEFRRDFDRPIVERVRVQDALHFHHYRWIGAPYFVGNHYVVRTIDPFGRAVLVEVNSYTGAFIGEFRI